MKSMPIPLDRAVGYLAEAAEKHLISRGGKRARPMALLLSAACFGPPPAAARELGVVAELVHSATLLHDDVIDEGMLRRGVATSRRLWGNGMSVLAGDLLLVRSLSRTMAVFPPALPALVEVLGQLVDGEIVQMRGRSDLDLSEATYERILQCKTASLFAWATCMGAMVSGASEAQERALGAFGEELGMAFQLVDDVLDYTGDRSGKSLFADLCEGKLTLPLVLAVRARPELMESVRRIHEGDAESVAELSRAVLDAGTCDEVRRRAVAHTERGLEALRAVPPCGARDLLEAVAVQLADRTS
jgi:octaprenyl-diphosphate synthase